MNKTLRNLYSPTETAGFGIIQGYQKTGIAYFHARANKDAPDHRIPSRRSPCMTGNLDLRESAWLWR